MDRRQNTSTYVTNAGTIKKYGDGIEIRQFVQSYCLNWLLVLLELHGFSTNGPLMPHFSILVGAVTKPCHDIGLGAGKHSGVMAR